MRNENIVHKKRTIHTTGPVLIIDRPIDETIKTQLSDCQTLTGEKIITVNTTELSSVLDQHIAGMNLPRETLFVFPGNGGLDVEKNLILLNGHPKARVFTKRIWHQGNDPFVIVNEIPSKTFIDLQTRVVFILDDVVSSGKTASELLKRSQWKFPKAIWYLGCWVDRGIKLKGFRHIFSALTIQHKDVKEKKVPINSLSTLITEPIMCEGYAKKNYMDYRNFLQILDQIRKRVTK